MKDEDPPPAHRLVQLNVDLCVGKPGKTAFPISTPNNPAVVRANFRFELPLKITNCAFIVRLCETNIFLSACDARGCAATAAAGTVVCASYPRAGIISKILTLGEVRSS